MHDQWLCAPHPAGERVRARWLCDRLRAYAHNEWLFPARDRRGERVKESERVGLHWNTLKQPPAKGWVSRLWIRAARHARLRETRGRRASGCPGILAEIRRLWDVLGALFWGRCAVGDGYRLMVPTKSLTTSPTSLTWLIAIAGRCSGVRSGQFKTSISGIFFVSVSQTEILMLLIWWRHFERDRCCCGEE